MGRVRRPDIAAAAGWTFDLEPGDRVAIVMHNRPQYLEAMFAAWHAGLVVVPVNARLHRDEIAFILEDSGTAVVVTDPEHPDDIDPHDHFTRCAVGPAHPAGAAPLMDRKPDDPAWLFYTSGTTGGPRARRSPTATC